MLLLHWLGKQVKAHNDNFQSYQPKLHIKIANIIHLICPTSPNSSSVTDACVQNVLQFHMHRPKVSPAIRQ